MILLILMVKHLQLFFLTAGIISSLLLVAGLLKPYALLWWKASQSRRMVIRLYGRVAIVCVAIYVLLKYFEVL